MVAKRDTSNAGLYDKLEALRLEFKQDLVAAVNSVAVSQGRLEKKFDDLEAGRLTRAEAHINDLRITIQRLSDKETTTNSKFYALETIRNILISAASAAFFLWLFTRGTK